MYLPKVPKIISASFPKILWNVPSDEKSIYLTFDDGPHPHITPWVLDQLKKANAKATFFCVGKNVELYPEIFEQIIAEGHTVGNHTLNHLSAFKSNIPDYLHDIEACNEVFRAIYFRPPYGLLRPRSIKKIQAQYKIVMWDVLSYDFDATISNKQCLANVLNHIKNGSIVVFHDSEKAKNHLEYTLPKVLEKLQQEKFEMKAL
jgi:peptidoglycan/xylan/chitin deacetylase (PgdA/CDA1 family)